jgi:hypothetical protein
MLTGGPDPALAQPIKSDCLARNPFKMAYCNGSGSTRDKGIIVEGRELIILARAIMRRFTTSCRLQWKKVPLRNARETSSWQWSKRRLRSMNMTCEEMYAFGLKGLRIGPRPSHLIASISHLFLQASPSPIDYQTRARRVEVRE